MSKISGSGDSEFKGFIFFTTRCQMSDDMELNINHGVPSLRVDFVPCPPPAIPGLIERLPFHHLNASFFHLLLRLCILPRSFFQFLKENNRYVCSIYAVFKWLEQRICSLSLDNVTQNLLSHNELPFK